MSVLSLSGANKSYGIVTVVDKLTLSINKGEAVGIIGPNGAGKSSLFNVISGLVRLDSGSIVLKGQDVTALSLEDRCRLGISRAFQIPKPFEGMTVYENLLVGSMFGAGRTQSESEGVSYGILDKTGLLSLANDKAGSLRLLDRKRLELAKALSTNPEVLLLDEIAGGLTEHECESLITLINSIKSDGVTIIWIEHVLRALMSFAERLIVLNFGKVIADGPPDQVWAMPEVKQIYLGIEA
jgi:branched-chain amino acid transport system ATP-binding protein